MADAGVDLAPGAVLVAPDGDLSGIDAARQVDLATTSVETIEEVQP